MPPANETSPLRVLLVDDGAHRVSLIRDELVRQGHDVVGVIDAPLLIHDCVTRLAPHVVIVDSESPSRDTLEHVATLSGSHPMPGVVFAEDEADPPMRQAMAACVSAYVVAGLQPHRLASVLRVAIARFEQWCGGPYYEKKLRAARTAPGPAAGPALEAAIAKGGPQAAALKKLLPKGKAQSR